MQNENVKIEGRNPVLEALKSGRQIDKIFIKKGEITGSATKIVAMAKDKKIPISQVEKSKLDLMSETGSLQGFIAFVPAKDYVTVDDILKIAQDKNKNNFDEEFDYMIEIAEKQNAYNKKRMGKKKDRDKYKKWDKWN